MNIHTLTMYRSGGWGASSDLVLEGGLGEPEGQRESYKLDRGICIAPTVPPSTLRITPVHHDPARLAK